MICDTKGQSHPDGVQGGHREEVQIDLAHRGVDRQTTEQQKTPDKLNENWKTNLTSHLWKKPESRIEYDRF